MASARSSPMSSNEVSRQGLQAKAVELRALHAAFLQGSSPANIRNATASPIAHSCHVTQFAAQDYPVFTPSYEEEPVPIGRKSRPLSGNWDGYGLDIASIAADTSSYNKALSSALCTSEKIHARFKGSCANSCRNQASVFKSSSPNTEFILRYARRNSLGDFSSLPSSNINMPVTHSTETDIGLRSFNSSIVAPSTDTHQSLMARPKSKGISLTWLFSKNKKKQHKIESSPCPMPDQAEQLSSNLKDMGVLAVEKLRKELMKATEEREAALLEVSEMRFSLGELKQKLEFLESYCKELKKALKAEKKDPRKVKNLCIKRENDRQLDEPDGHNNLMPVSEEVMVEGFLQIVSEARLSVNQFCKYLVAQIEETDESLIDNLNILLQPYKVSLHSRSSKSVLYHLEALINQSLYQDFENPVFQKNGAPKHLDRHQDREAHFASYVALRNLSWNEVLSKGTKYYSEEFSKFCDQKMSSIISMLDWNNPWPEQLLQVFFVAAKCIWLLHLLAFSFDPPLTIVRVEENSAFDPQYMEDMLVDRHRSQTDLGRVKIMVMPGFYVNDKVLRCKVIARHHPMT
ncbi:unnamed protein product [Rhodiola kirilowii]